MYKLTLTDAKLRTGKRIKVGVDCEKSMKKALDCSATYEEEEEEEEGEEEEKQKGRRRRSTRRKEEEETRVHISSQLVSSRASEPGP